MIKSRDIQQRLQQATRDRVPLSVQGTGSRGLAPSGTPIAVGTLSAIEQLDCAEQVVTCGPGVRLEQLDRELALHGLVLAPTYPLHLLAHWGFLGASTGTVGGLYSDPRPLPLCAGWGRVRDSVLGIEAVRGDGTPFKSGGRVVKNVTGYDLTRLLCGARGRLGVVTRVHLRLRPRPAFLGGRHYRFADPESLWSGLRSLRHASFDPLLVAVSGPARALVIEAGSRSVVRAHLSRIDATLDCVGEDLGLHADDVGLLSNCPGNPAPSGTLVRAPFTRWATTAANPGWSFPWGHCGWAMAPPGRQPEEPAPTSWTTRLIDAWDPARVLWRDELAR